MATLHQLLVISIALSGEHENDDQIGTFIGEGRCPDFARGEGWTGLAFFLVLAGSEPTFANSALGPDRRICVNPSRRPDERFCFHSIAPKSRARACSKTAGREFGSFGAVLSARELASRNRKVEIMSEGPVPKSN